MQPGTRNRIAVLDGVRGLAILLVLIGHVRYAADEVTGSFIGNLGVSLFFVLSGYLITRVLVADELRFERVRLLHFYQRRALRIVPALLVFLCGLGVLGHYAGLPPLSRETWAASLLYFRNFSGEGWDTGHLWSLSLEEQFYVIWPVGFVLLRNRKLRLRAILLTVVILTTWRLAAPHPFVAILEWPDLRLDTFLIGAAFALGWQCYPARAIPAECIATALLGWSWLIPGNRFGTSFLCAVQALMIAILIDRAVRQPTVISRFLSTPAMMTMGLASYSLYLWQQIFLGPHLSIWSIPALIAVAATSYWLIERPFLRLRRAESAAYLPGSRLSKSGAPAVLPPVGFPASSSG